MPAPSAKAVAVNFRRIISTLQAAVTLVAQSTNHTIAVSGGGIVKWSLMPFTPTIASTAIRAAFFSSFEVTKPHRSTLPSCTVTLSRDGRHCSAFSRESTWSRISESSVCAAHDSHDFSILHNRHSFDTISFQQSCDFAERGIRRRGNHRARHDIADL